MEYEDLEKDLTCPICLCIFTDPVSLPCGHIFCRLCIIKVLVTQEGPAGYSCPYCRAKYQNCPKLAKKKKTTMALDNIAERFLIAPSDMEESRVLCSFCIDSVPAVRSSLCCEKSFCDEHLMKHSANVEYIITEPISSFDGFKHYYYKSNPEYYCPHCSAFLCNKCYPIYHVSRQRALYVSEKFEHKKKQILMNYMDELNPKKTKIQERLQSLKENKINIREEALNMSRSISKLYLNIKEKQEMSEREALSEISRKEEMIFSSSCDLIRKLEIQEEELSRKMREVEKICHITNPLRILEESDFTTGDLRE